MDSQLGPNACTPANHGLDPSQEDGLLIFYSPHHQSIKAHGNNVVTALHLDNDRIISASDDRTVNIYDTRTLHRKHILKGHTGGVWAIQYVDGMLVTASTDKTVRVWDVDRVECTHVFRGHESTVRCLKVVMPKLQSDGTYVPEDPVIVSGSRDKNLCVWKLPKRGSTYLAAESAADGTEASAAVSLVSGNPYFLRKMEGHTHSVRVIAAEGDIVVSGSYDSTVRVWKISTGKCQWKLEGHTSKIYSVVYDAEKQRVYSGSMDHTIKVWDLITGTLISTLEGHTSLVGLMELSTFLVSAAPDTEMRIWNTETLECEHVIKTEMVVNGFQCDEDKIIGGSGEGVMVWDINTGKLRRKLIDGISVTWMVKFDEKRCVASVQKDKLTWIDVFKFDEDGGNSEIPIDAEKARL